MPVRRKAGTPPQDTPPTDVTEGDPAAAAEETAPLEEEPESPPAPQAPPADGAEVEGGLEEAGGAEAVEVDKEGESMETSKADQPEKGAEEEKTPEEGAEGEKKEEKDAGKEEKEKVKKVKRTIPAWASVAASKRGRNQKGSTFLHSQPKLDDILVEAIQASKERSGASAYAIMKYITRKYASLELDRRKFLIRKALKRLVEKGVVKQLKGKGFSGSFAIGKLPPKPSIEKPVVAPGVKAETLGDTLPLIITRLCEPKEASYVLIKKYLEKHFPKLNVEHRPEVLKSALQKAVEKGHLEQITGKGASGTFQLKRSGDKPLLKGGALENAILTAITAMNEPKSCSTALLRKFLMETNKDSKAYMLVSNLKRTLKRGKMMGWIEQVTGSGLNGTYQLCYPYYPSPAILFPEKQSQESEEEDEEEESDDESEEEPPPRKRSVQQKRPVSRVRHPPSARTAKGKRPTPAKRPAPPAKKAAPPAKKAAPPPKKAAPPARKVAPPAKKATPPARKVVPPAKKATPPARKVLPPAKKPKAALSRKSPLPHKATPTKKAAPASKPKTPVAKKLTSRVPKKSSSTKTASRSPVKAKPAARTSLRSKK
ncbi:heterochromatin protein 1-binding protein 3-like [Megalops cyprinoides]|uniref:heterochromatin protein 1-binding protein 3-like n=1 Tax=Megalops cyprinoides TaxID=118141 RepID=UPI0018652AF8|nr:heterochromatin protein 1-binding protein 3-like [Megalops cyprinoides]